MSKVPKVQSYEGYEAIVLTGGEPMLKQELVHETISNIRRVSKAPIYMYTAHVVDCPAAIGLLVRLNGLTLTLHAWDDVWAWRNFRDKVTEMSFQGTLRLRVSPNSNLNIDYLDAKGWEAEYIKWKAECPVPANEELMRL